MTQVALSDEIRNKLVRLLALSWPLFSASVCFLAPANNNEIHQGLHILIGRR